MNEPSKLRQRAGEIEERQREQEREQRERESEERREEKQKRAEVREVLQQLDEADLVVLADRASNYDFGSGLPLRNAIGEVERRNPGDPFSLSRIEAVAADVLDERRRARAQATRTDGGQRAELPSNVEVAGREVPTWAVALVAVVLALVAFGDGEEPR